MQAASLAAGALAPASISAAMLARFDAAVPRYTSYPTAVEFRDGFTAEDYDAALTSAATHAAAPLAVYIHLPFCAQRCHFCGCHAIVARQAGLAETYVRYLQREMALVAARLGPRRAVAQLHLGGGTPTFLAPALLASLLETVRHHFSLLPEAELAVEADPRVTTPAHLETLARYGFWRLSVGVQDFSPVVQESVQRMHSFENTARVVAQARAGGMRSINIDLIYGLPWQTRVTFGTTLAQVLSLAPERVAVYSMARVPWLKSHQKRMPAEGFPGREEKFALALLAREMFLQAGYHAIGMDHYALAHDALAVAQAEGRLQRNFMGYTVQPAADLLGFGISAIGDVQGCYVQNQKKLKPYYQALDAGVLPVHKGYRLSRDDGVHRAVIEALMCRFAVDIGAFEQRFNICFADYFAQALPRLEPYAAAGLVEVSATHLRATAAGRYFVRNLASCFDAYYHSHQERPGGGTGAHFSRSV